MINQDTSKNNLSKTNGLISFFLFFLQMKNLCFISQWTQTKWGENGHFYASAALMEPGPSLSSSLLIGMSSMPKLPMAKLMKTCEGLEIVKMCNANTKHDCFPLSTVIVVNVSFPLTPLFFICLWYVPIPEPQKEILIEEYQHWLHVKLMDSLPNSDSTFSPQAYPLSVSLCLFYIFSLCLLFHSHSAFFCPCFPSYHLSSSLISCPVFLSLAAIYPALRNFTLLLSLFLSAYVLSLFLTSSSVVWLTEKCLICRAFLLDSSWSKMSATPPGATGTWYSTIVECWSCVLEKNAC